MNSELAPKLIHYIKGFYVLWFEKSNRYILLDENNMHIVKSYLQCSNKTDFYSALNAKHQTKTVNLFEEVTILLKDCNTAQQANEVIQTKQIVTGDWKKHIYRYGNNTFKINYANDKIKLLIHPSIGHLETKDHSINISEFYIDLKEDQLWLFKHHDVIGFYPKTDYHLLQGKLAMELLCLFNNNSEDDWMGTFHASTISNAHEAIMLIGTSGKGKSTLSAILMNHGYHLVADDFTPIHAESHLIYHYPSAISIKEGSLKTLEPLFKNLKNVRPIFLNPSKGGLRYIPPFNKIPTKPFPCNKIVLVNYKKDATSILEEIGIENILSVLIPDSWLSPIVKNAEHFLNWLNNVTFYQLTYSNNKEAIKIFENLFQSKQ